MLKFLKSTAAIVAIVAPIAATADEAQIAEINERYEEAFAALQVEMQEWSEDAPDPSTLEATLDVSGQLSWEITDFSFDIPSVRFETREFSLDLPQFTYERTGFSMDIPVITMETTKVGEYPCFRGWKWYSCDMTADVPQVRMERQEFSLDLPQVSWDRTSFSMDIPEFDMERVEIKMHLQQFDVDSVSGEISDFEEEGDVFEARADALAEEQIAEITAVVSADLEALKEEAISVFDVSLHEVNVAIAEVEGVGADPTALGTDNGIINLLAVRAEITANRDAAIAQFDAAMSQVAS